MAATRTLQDRRDLGKQARAAVPRSSHGMWSPPVDRPDPVALLKGQESSRVSELIPIRYERMGVSAFTFFRGGALIMASDLSTTPRSGIETQICGDAHLSNFGAYASAERALVFDLNDFDETLPGPWEWDLKRLVASFEIAGRDRGFSSAERQSVVSVVGKTYRETIRSFAKQGELDVWYAKLDTAELVEQLRARASARRMKRVEASLEKARGRDSMHAYAKLVRQVDGHARIISDPPLIVPIDELLSGTDHDTLISDLRKIVRSYRTTLTSDRKVLFDRYDLVDFARKVVGVGSVGTRAFILLMEGRDGSDPLFLQAKEAQPSVLEGFLKPSAQTNAGARVVAGQRLMQASSDIFLGWVRATGADGVKRDFYLRQLRDWKGSADVDVMDPKGMGYYATMCGWTLARAHARSGDRVAIASYLGAGDVFDQALVAFAAAYADQNEADYDAFKAALKDGVLTPRRRARGAKKPGA